MANIKYLLMLVAFLYGLVAPATVYGRQAAAAPFFCLLNRHAFVGQNMFCQKIQHVLEYCIIFVNIVQYWDPQIPLTAEQAAVSALKT